MHLLCSKKFNANVTTVEPPNKGHFGNRPFVQLEVVLISEVCHSDLKMC